MTTIEPDVVGALEVAHVVALDPQRRLGQVERVLEGVEGPGPGVVVGRPLAAGGGRTPRLALRVTVSSRARLSPRWGARISTCAVDALGLTLRSTR